MFNKATLIILLAFCSQLETRFLPHFSHSHEEKSDNSAEYGGNNSSHSSEFWTAGFVEGDIFVRQKSRAQTMTREDFSSLRWDPESIPYKIDHNLVNYTNLIRQSLAEFEKTTCIQFTFLDGNDTQYEDFLIFTSIEGCGSFIGKQGGAQVISLQAGTCTYKGVIMHLVFHSLGFGHEHNRPDRDSWIEIFWEQVEPDLQQYLNKYNNETDVFSYGETYDYYSLLHGSNYLFAMNSSQLTIIAKDDPELKLGQRDRLSTTDIRRLNTHYSCTTTTTSVMGSTSVVVTNQNCNGSIPSYPDPTDCGKFYVCFGMTSFSMECPSGLSYNPTLYVCDWPWNVPCYHIPKLVYDNIKPITINVTEDSEKWQLAAINKMIEDNNKNMSSS